MIQKGIIEEIINDYQYKVRVPKYDKITTDVSATSTADLNIAITCVTPGAKILYAIGDIVLVSYENDELSKPVILGLLYRDTEISAQVTIPSVDAKLNSLSENLALLQNQDTYTHIKYSNDNGVTFTSLYDYTIIYNKMSDTTVYRSADDIEIDPTSSTAYWIITNSVGEDVTKDFLINTTFRVDGQTILDPTTNTQIPLTYTTTDTLIDIPVNCRNYDNLKLSFEISDVADYESYHIVLTTDKNVIGSTYGKYVGLYIGYNPVASINVNDYVWLSFDTMLQYYIDTTKEELEARIARNEETLYGYNYSTDTQETNNTGLLDAIAVSDELIDIHGSDNKNIYFNSAKTIFINNKKGCWVVGDILVTNGKAPNTFKIYFRDNGHFSIVKI